MAAEVAHLDIETRSDANLKAVGLYKYFESPNTGLLCVRWQLGDQKGDETNLGPFLSHIQMGGVVTGHNIAFDRTGWNKFYPEHHISIEQTDCTMARCAALSVPHSLEKAAQALHTPIPKDTEGHKLMMRMCKPKKIVDGVITWRESPEELTRLGTYCATDVEAEGAIDRAVPQLTALQRQTWILDQHINERGVKIDLDFARKAVELARKLLARNNAELKSLTGGAVTNTTQVGRLTTWLRGRGLHVPSLDKKHIDDALLLAELYDDVEALKAIKLRQASAKSSLAKYQAMIDCAGADGRVRGTLQYHGAHSGRWSGRLIQPQNFPRVSEGEAEEVERLRAMMDAPLSKILAAFANPLAVLSKALRSTLIAEEGYTFFGGDFSNIEGRVNAWLAGEDWATDAFICYDIGIGPDLYKLTYSKVTGKPIGELTDADRQLGKALFLSLGYQGGHKALQKYAAVSDAVGDEFKVAWREANPNIKSSWFELQDAAIRAVRHPGLRVPCLNGRIEYLVARDILWCRLPSGRCLSYPRPFITQQAFINEDGEMELTNRPQVAYRGVDQVTKKWGVRRLYGGMQCENVVQAISYDILVEVMFRLEAAGYPIVLTVHDEILCEVKTGDMEEFKRLMTPSISWAKSLPLAVSAWNGPRYAK